MQLTSDRFTQFVAAGVAMWLMVQVITNIGATLKLLPITGVTLPLVSYGGSSLIPVLMGIGVILLVLAKQVRARPRCAAALRDLSGPSRCGAIRAPCADRRPAPATPGEGRDMTINVVVAGGGTAGHIEPAMNLADYLRDHEQDVAITALGTEKGLETRLVPATRLPVGTDPAGAAAAQARQGPGNPARAAADLDSGCEGRAATTAADVVVGFGGYVSIPAYFAARQPGVPIVVHEANAKPGLANRVGARFTPFVAENYAGSLPGAVRLGLPLRTAISGLDRYAERGAGRAFFGLDPDAPCVLVFGGSQGAKRLNEAVWGALPQLRDREISILHAYGPKTDTALVPAAPDGPHALRPGAVRRPDGPRLCRGRSGGVPLGCDDVWRDRSRRAAGGLRSLPDRQRGAALQRRARRAGRRRRCWSMMPT